MWKNYCWEEEKRCCCKEEICNPVKFVFSNWGLRTLSGPAAKTSGSQNERWLWRVRDRCKNQNTTERWPFVFLLLQFAARSWGDGTEETGETRVWRRNEELLLWGGLHLRKHRERVVLFHLTGQSHKEHTRKETCSLSSTPNSVLCSRQERQSIIKYWLDNLRAKNGDVLHNINFMEGQPISALLIFIKRPFLTNIMLTKKHSYLVAVCSRRVECTRCHPAAVSSPWTEDPQSADEVLGAGCLWETTLRSV